MRVLIVDDNHDIADLCSMILEKSGHEVRTAYSGKEALDMAAEFTPNIMMLDIGMPDINGYDVAREIRACEWGKKVLLLAISGWSQEEDKRRAIEAGFDHHITKPFDLSVLDELKLIL